LNDIFKFKYTIKIQLAVQSCISTQQPAVTVDSKLLFHIHAVY